MKFASLDGRHRAWHYRVVGTDATLSPFAQTCRALRKSAGLSLEDATFAIRAYLPEPLWVKSSTIRRLETGFTPETKASPTLLAALAAVYGVPITELSPTAADGLLMVQHLADRTAATSSYPQFASGVLVHAA